MMGEKSGITAPVVEISRATAVFEVGPAAARPGELPPVRMLASK
jgi:hypothetical protein